MITFCAIADTGPAADFATITAAREWAESLGDTAAQVAIYRVNTRGRIINERAAALHVRDTAGNGRRWFKGSLS
jgi:hypothetical protein